MRTTLLLLSFVFLLSCTQSGNPIQVNSPAPILEKDTLHITKEFNGIFMNDGTRKFISCDNPALTYLLGAVNYEADSALKRILPNAYPGQGIYVQMMAEIYPSDNKNYAGILEVKQVLKSEQKNSKNTCLPYDYWCSGTEPFWQLQISKTENLIDFYNPMEQTTIHFLYAEPEEKEGAVIYTATQKENSKNKIQVSIYKEKCSDGMSEKQYNYRVGVILDRRYSGCAVKFGE